MTKPTKRQIEAMRSIYLGRSIYDRSDRPDMGRRFSSSMGGAVALMRDRMGEAGWLQVAETSMGRTYYRNSLSALGLRALQSAHPDLDGIEAKIAEADQAEASAAALAASKREADAKLMTQRAIERRINRVAALREIAQAYQVRLDLSDEQCAAMWREIIDREHRI